MTKGGDGRMKLNFYPFHKHNYELIRWRLVHHPHWEPLRIVTRLKCKSCGKEINRFVKERRDESFESENRHLEGFWLGNEKEVAE